jgi:hypothetical protein
MNKLKYILGLWVAFAVQSCTDFVDPAIPYSNFETAVYLRTISATPNINYFQLNTEVWNLVVEAVDETNGNLVESVDVFVRRRRLNTLSPEVQVTTIPKSAFAPTSESKYLRATITVTIANALTAMGFATTDINGGDFFEFRLLLKDSKDRTFTNTNLSPDISGGQYYLSPFFYRVPVVCPSVEADWVKTYNSVANGSFGDGSGGTAGSYSNLQTTITITKRTQDDAGVYYVSDMSFGLYPIEYGDLIPPGRIRDVCGLVADVGDTDRYGDPFTISGSRNAGNGVITLSWINTWGDRGDVVLTPQ